jgi:glucan phosphoethanolaminetransferase (alkaline phosphatase superfamily)
MDYRKQKYFAFAFLGRLTHDKLNNAGFTDPIVAKLFNKLFDQNLLSNTILVFFSDHGLRFGPIRETLSGKLEERMPFMHLYLPEKWRNKYDKYLTINQNRLTTPFDIHATLTHIIRGKEFILTKHYQMHYCCDSRSHLKHVFLVSFNTKE